jgi:hypothetical protein
LLYLATVSLPCSVGTAHFEVFWFAPQERILECMRGRQPVLVPVHGWTDNEVSCLELRKAQWTEGVPVCSYGTAGEVLVLIPPSVKYVELRLLLGLLTSQQWFILIM